MPFERPTLSALVERVRSDIRGRLGISGPLLRRAMADVLATVWAGAVHMLHGHLEWLGKQLFADTAEREYLLRQAALYGITPTPATYASGFALVIGTADSVIPEGAILQVDGVQFRATEETTLELTDYSQPMPVEAVLAGTGGNMGDGVELTFESPIAGVQAAAPVEESGITGGFDEETTEGTRDRLLLRLREPPMGGADRDYEAWTIAVAGVTRAWVYPHENGLGTVVVRFVLDEEADIFPEAGTVAAVQAALDAQRPITAEVTAEAPTPLEVDFSLSVTPDTVAVQAAVTAELTDLLYREAEPGDGAGRGTLRLSRITTAIGIAEGIEDFTLTTPAADVVPAAGELAVLGEVTFA